MNYKHTEHEKQLCIQTNLITNYDFPNIVIKIILFFFNFQWINLAFPKIFTQTTNVLSQGRCRRSQHMSRLSIPVRDPFENPFATRSRPVRHRAPPARKPNVAACQSNYFSFTYFAQFLLIYVVLYCFFYCFLYLFIVFIYSYYLNILLYVFLWVRVVCFYYGKCL